MNLTNRLFKGDRVIWVIFLLLCIVSVIEVFSAVSTLTYKSGDYWAPITKHVMYMMVGVGCTLGLHHMPYRWFKLIPYILTPLSLVLLVLVLFVGKQENEAARWFSIGGFRFQPSEFARPALIATVALFLSRAQTDEGTDKAVLKPILLITLIFCTLILPENFSTAALLFAVVYLMLIIGRIPAKQMLSITGISIAAGVAMLVAIMVVPSGFLQSHKDNKLLHRVETWQGRFKKFTSHKEWVEPENYKVTDDNRQRTHGNYAIAGSNILGKGPGNSEERNYLSQAYSDFIYAIIIEELGLLGGAVVLMLFLMLLVRAGRIVKKCESSFAAFLVLGFTLMMVLQALLNMMVAVDFIPITGQNLPLISRGGSSLITNCIYIGIILSVSRHVNQKEEERRLEEQKGEENEILSAIPEEYSNLAN